MLDLKGIGLSGVCTQRLVSVALVRQPLVGPSQKRLKSSGDVWAELKGLADLDRECFVALHLDQKNRVTGVDVVSVGSVAASLVHPREVFKSAIVSNAASVLLVHNHPSGDPKPSREDQEITERLKKAGELLGIPVLDHVIIAAQGHFSFADCPVP